MPRARQRRCGMPACKPLLAPWYASVEEILRRNAGRFDLVYLHRAGNAAAYSKLVRQHCANALLVYGVADLHHLRLARQGAVEDRPELQAAARCRRFEALMAAQLADVVITHSHAEAAWLRQQIPGIRPAVIPWSVPVRRDVPGFAQRRGVAFIGNFGHVPNPDAVHFLAQAVLPLVRQADAYIRFQVIGSDMLAAARALARPGLEMVGPVPARDAVLDSVRLSIAPLRFCAGLNDTVMQSMAAGVPCVGTAIAYEGMDIAAPLAGCIADSPQALAAAILRLHGDAAAWSAVSHAGLRHALVTFSASAVEAEMRAVVAPVLRRWARIEAQAG